MDIKIVAKKRIFWLSAHGLGYTNLPK